MAFGKTFRVDWVSCLGFLGYHTHTEEEALITLRRLYEDGWSTSELAEHCCVNDKTVRRALRAAGTEIRSRGGPNNTAELTIPHEEFTSGKTLASIAREYNVSRNQVIRHRYWYRRKGLIT